MMRSNNHYVVRNGKLVSKSEAQNMPSPESVKINIVKPSTVIVRYLDEKQSNVQKNNQLSCLKKYYQEIISKHEQHIDCLERQLAQKNFIIQKLNLDKAENQLKYTARDSRTSATSGKDQAPAEQQDTSKSKNIFIQDKILLKINETNSLQDSKLQIIEKQEEQKQKKSFQEQDSLSRSMYRNNSEPSLQSNGESISAQAELKENDSKASFDTSTLMARLNKSASLVRNIKKFLQPAHMSPQQFSGLQPPQSPKFKNQQIQVAPSNLNISSASGQSSQTQSQLPKFIDELVDKHEQILYLMQSLTLQKDLEIKQIKQHYQQIISKLQKNRSCSSSFKCYPKSNSKVILKNFTQNKENSQNQKILQKGSEKDTIKQKNAFDYCRNKYQQVDWDLFSDSQTSSQYVSEVVQVQEEQFF